MQRFALFLVAALACVLLPGAASAQIKTLVTGKNWSAYSLADKNGATCYLVGHPTKAVPNGGPRKAVDAMVSHRVNEKAWYVVTFNLGYAAKEGAKAELAIDNTKKFTLFVEKEAAWAADAPTDKQVAQALSKGKVVTIKATSAKGTNSTDTYSLDGFEAALKAIDTACTVPH